MTDTLRSICEQCTYLNHPQLDFIPDSLARHKEIISRDLKELVSVAASEHEKAVVLLAGSLFECILYTFIKAYEALIAVRRTRPITLDPEKKGLRDYLNIFNRWFRTDFPNLKLQDLIADYRDLVHFNQELNLPPGECREAAAFLLRNLDAMLGELGKFGSESE